MRAGKSLVQSAIIAMAIIAVATGCARRDRIGADEELRYAGFMQDGHTTKNEVEARLGPPRSVFEDGKVLIYRVFMDDEGRMNLRFKGGQTPVFECSVCILEFDEKNVLVRHSIVKNGCR
jgi:hypothetical protein